MQGVFLAHCCLKLVATALKSFKRSSELKTDLGLIGMYGCLEQVHALSMPFSRLSFSILKT